MPWDERDEGQGGSIEYNLTIAESKVDYTEYNEGNTCLWIIEGEKEFDNGKLMDDNLWIGAPKGGEGWTWTHNDAHTAFVPTDGDPDRRFSKQSKIQQFINSAVNAGAPIKERTENSLDVAGWTGLKLRIREEEKSGTFDGETRTWRQPLVIEYLGEVGGKAAPKKSESKAAKAGSNGSDDELVAKARLLAQEEEDLIEYMTRATKELGVPLDHEVCSATFHKTARS